MNKDQWIADVEHLQEAFADEKMDVEAFTNEMRWMGFDLPEIEAMISEIREAQ